MTWLYFRRMWLNMELCSPAKYEYFLSLPALSQVEIFDNFARNVKFDCTSSLHFYYSKFELKVKILSKTRV